MARLHIVVNSGRITMKVIVVPLVMLVTLACSSAPSSLPSPETTPEPAAMTALLSDSGPEGILAWSKRVEAIGPFWLALASCEPDSSLAVPLYAASEEAWDAAMPYLANFSTRTCILRLIAE